MGELTDDDRLRFDLEAEVYRLQGIIDGLAARVAGQAELLSRNAERDALGRLQAWLASNPQRYACLDLRLSGDFVCCLTQLPGTVLGRDPELEVATGSLAASIDAALDRGQELYGEVEPHA
jgi:hypothetical protein